MKIGQSINRKRRAAKIEALSLKIGDFIVASRGNHLFFIGVDAAGALEGFLEDSTQRAGDVLRGSDDHEPAAQLEVVVVARKLDFAQIDMAFTAEKLARNDVASGQRQARPAQQHVLDGFWRGAELQRLLPSLVAHQQRPAWQADAAKQAATIGIAAAFWRLCGLCSVAR